jgi:hypothetical protein
MDINDQQWQDFSGQVTDFDDTLNNQQLVRDPNRVLPVERRSAQPAVTKLIHWVPDGILVR